MPPLYRDRPRSRPTVDGPARCGVWGSPSPGPLPKPPTGQIENSWREVSRIRSISLERARSVLTPSHRRYAILWSFTPLTSLTLSRLRRAQTAVAGAGYPAPLVISAHAMRAVLFAHAMITSIGGLRKHPCRPGPGRRALAFGPAHHTRTGHD